MAPFNATPATAEAAAAAAEAHAALLSQLDMLHAPKPFRNPDWKPATRRNKTVKQILSEEARREAAASALATQNASATNSGTATPAQQTASESARHKDGVSGMLKAVTTKAAQQAAAANAAATATAAVDTGNASNAPANGGQNGSVGPTTVAQEEDFTLLDAEPTEAQVAAAKAHALANMGPAATFTDIDAAPSTHPGRRCKKYCDVTGLPAMYTDPKTKLHYHNKEVFAAIRGFTTQQIEERLALRNAHTILK